MPETASLGRFNIMEHTTSDDFDAQHSEKQSDADEMLQTIVEGQPELTTAEEDGSSAPSAQDQLPPEAQGDVNGGPLGCCLGTIVGLFLSITVAVLSRFYTDPLGALFHQNYGLMGNVIRVLMGILAVVLAIFGGRFGWKLGRRFYREYEAPPVKARKRPAKPQHQKV